MSRLCFGRLAHCGCGLTDTNVIAQAFDLARGSLASLASLMPLRQQRRDEQHSGRVSPTTNPHSPAELGQVRSTSAWPFFFSGGKGKKKVCRARMPILHRFKLADAHLLIEFYRHPPSLISGHDNPSSEVKGTDLSSV